MQEKTDWTKLVGTLSHFLDCNESDLSNDMIFALRKSISTFQNVPASKRPVCDMCKEIVHEYYTLNDEIWKQVAILPRGHLHLKCTEQRLGRPLTHKDFKDVPLNQSVLYFLRKQQ